MSQATATPVTDLDPAFAALERYHHGSPRGDLLPIDNAVRAAIAHPARQPDLEARLLALLESPAAVVAKEYACRQLTLIASTPAIPVLSRLLPHPDLGQAARATLEAIPGPEADQALAAALRQLAGPAAIGVAHSVGARRVASALPALQTLLDHPDTRLVEAALIALGRIGTPPAAAFLRTFAASPPPSLRAPLGDALLIAAEQLLADRESAAATETARAAATPPFPPHIREAAERLLAST